MECPCKMFYETLEETLSTVNPLIGPGGRCTAEYADESLNDDGTPKICKRPLGAHPHKPSGINILL